MKVTSYNIKTHNPIILFLIAVIWVPISLYTLYGYSRDIAIFGGAISLVGVLLLCNYFLGHIIEIEMTDKGIATTWTKLPFFKMYYKEILWTDIKNWKFEAWRMADTFSIKTKQNEKLYIRCLNVLRRQENLNNFLQDFQDSYESFKSESTEISK